MILMSRLKISGNIWNEDNYRYTCIAVEFEAGEGVRFAEAIEQLAKEVDAKEWTKF